MGTAGVIALVIWLLLGLAGAWHLITGRKMVFGLPRDFREGWPVRVFGLVNVLLAAFVAYQDYRLSQGLSVPGGIVFVYTSVTFAVLLVVLAVLDHRRTAGRPG